MIRFDNSLINSDSLDVAVSMGEDSVVLSHFLCYGKRSVRLHYVDHGTEYASKAKDGFLKYVEVLKNKFGPKIEGIIHEDTLVKGTMSKEAEFREYRYGLFDYYFENKNEDAQLVVCHHLQDAVESYVMSKFTSATSHRNLPVKTQRRGYQVVRPFILTKKEDIKECAEKFYLMGKPLKDFIVEDPSNKDTKYKRNWVRLELLPKIREEFGIDKVVKKLYL